MTIQLIDLSNNNPAPHFPAVRLAGIQGCWLKVSEGLNFPDATWQARSAAARQAGLHIGGYHFARPSAASGDATSQANYFAHLLGPIQSKDLRPALDLEDSGHLTPTALRQWVHDFNQQVLKATGTGPLFYSYTAFIQGLAWDTPAGYGLWLADYAADDGQEHPAAPPAPWKHIRAHQYTSRGTVPGIAGNVDRTSAPSLTPLLAHPL